jgi:hypothetical protein
MELMTDDSKFKDNPKPLDGRIPLKFDKELKQAAEAVKKIIIEEEEEGRSGNP